ncbi:MAG: aspartate aminotransferase family protein [Thermomicrobiales bacterium]|nr:aspartate aminotransferase family protein [Thermomicrobiales bacterium]
MTAPFPTLQLDLIAEIERDRQLPLYAKRDIALVRGEGAYLFDSAGNRYLDAMSNYGVAALGHADPEYTGALLDQLQHLTTCHQSFYNDARAAALAAIGQIAPAGLNRTFFSNSGAEAIEAAIKFARVTTGRNHFVAARRGYHGRTLGALAITADPKYRGPFEPFGAEVTHVPYNDAEAIEAAITEQTAAVILEPIQGEAGVYPGEEAFLRAARTAATTYGALFIADEIQTGFRTGAPFAISASDVTPDILCSAKAIANGFPIGVTLVTDAVSEAVPAGTHGTTFGANPLACRAVVATLDAFEKRNLYANSTAIGTKLIESIEALGSPKIRAVRGRGLMIGVELKERVTPTLKAMQERGVLALPASPVVFRLLPPLIWGDEQVDEFVTALEGALA